MIVKLTKPVVAILLLFMAVAVGAAPIDLRIVSDGSWRSSDTLYSGWNTTGYDDSYWHNARSGYPNPNKPTDVISGTTAEFIWHDPDGNSNGKQGPIQAFFRYSFNLDIAADSLPFIGQAIIDVDDDFDFYVNGHLVLENHDGGASQSVTTFTNYLTDGLNVIAIQAVDGQWGNPYDRLYEHVLFDGVIRTVPEPTTAVLMLLGLLGVVSARTRK
jgi:hypothetical protein